MEGLIQAATADVQPVCDHPGSLTKAQRQKIASARYKRSAREKRRKKLQLAGMPKCEIDRIIRAEFPVRARRMVFNQRRVHATDH